MAHDDDPQVREEESDNVLTLTLARPGRGNAFSERMADELIAAMDRADGADDVQVVLVTGDGPEFCGGADDEPPGGREAGGRVALRIFESMKPVVVAYNGPAVGVGLALTFAADLRLASTEARFGLAPAQRGGVLEGAASWFLPRLVGVGRAADWVHTGRTFDAAEAAAAGLVQAVHPPAELRSAARAVAQDIARTSAPVSVALNRQMLWRMLGAEHPMTAHVLESRARQDRSTAEDVKEAAAAQREHRAPRFRNRVSTDMPDFYPWWPARPFLPLGRSRG